MARINAIIVVSLVTACVVDEQPEVLSELELEATVCGAGPTVKGIDVSYYQGNIDWARVANDGVEYTFIRVSDGLGTVDTKFETYWEQSRANGIIHGAYQFFRPNQDPIAQAELFLDKIGGSLAPDDLPPVIDIEAAGGLPAADVAAKAKQWIDHVQAALGVKPIIYTGFYFWRDEVGAPAFGADYLLWHAQYTTAACPNIAAPWASWAFWQYTSTGAVDGIAGNVDINRFDGTLEQLHALTRAGGNGGAPKSCGVIAPEGGVIDDGDTCFTGGGPAASMRAVTTAGEGGDLVWTYTTDKPAEANNAQWNLDLAEAGRYQLEVYTAGAFAKSTRARYTIRANGAEQDVMIDQTAVDGWQPLVELELAAGGDQWIHLGDNTGEPNADQVQLAFDAVRITRIVEDEDEDDVMDDGPLHAGCQTGGGSPGLLALGLVLGLRRRRARR